MFNNFCTSRERSKYFSVFSLSFIFIFVFVGIENFHRTTISFSLLITNRLIFWLRLDGGHNSWGKWCILAYASASNFPNRDTNRSVGSLYIVIHRRTVVLYHNSSGWLEQRDSLSLDWNQGDFKLVGYLTLEWTSFSALVNNFFYIYLLYLYIYVIRYLECSILEKKIRIHTERNRDR